MFRVHTLAKGSGVIQCANSTCIHFQFSWWIDSSHDLGTGTASVRIAPASAACLRASVEFRPYSKKCAEMWEKCEKGKGK